MTDQTEGQHRSDAEPVVFRSAYRNMRSSGRAMQEKQSIVILSILMSPMKATIASLKARLATKAMRMLIHAWDKPSTSFPASRKLESVIASTSVSPEIKATP